MARGVEVALVGMGLLLVIFITVLAFVAVQTGRSDSTSVAVQTGRSDSTSVSFDVVESSIMDLQAAMEAGDVTSQELVELYLARIAAFDQQGPSLNTMVFLNPNALAEAKALDAERADTGPRGPLHGVPVIIKDNYDTFDMPTTSGSLALEGMIPPDDAFQVMRLREAGAVIIGKSNLHEFARGFTTISSLGGQTLNPYDTTRNPGGSSGGTGAAVAASFAAVGMGSDTCGSIRIPSAHNALTGLRVTRGLSSRDGISPLSDTQDVGGPLGRTVEDIAIVLDATVGYDPNDPITELGVGKAPESYLDFLQTGAFDGARIGIIGNLSTARDGEEEVFEILHLAAGEMTRLGATVITVSIQRLTAKLAATGVITEEFGFNIADYLNATPAAKFKTAQELLDSGLIHPSLERAFLRSIAVETLDTPAYRQKLRLRDQIRLEVLDLMARNDLDALMYPTIKLKAAPVGERQNGFENCRLSAHTGLPAISFPGPFTLDGLPVGIELLARPWEEGKLLRLAYSYEQATHHRIAPASVPALPD